MLSISGLFSKMSNSCPSIVRVYSDDLEQEEYPLLGQDLFKPDGTNTQPSLSVDNKSILLHHKIRNDPERGQTIQEYDMLFDMYKEDITHEQVDEYRKIVSAAKTEELRKSSIVMCSLQTAASLSLDKLNVRQVSMTELSNFCIITLNYT